MVDFVSISISIVVSVSASIFALEYRMRRENSQEEAQEKEQWYSKAARLASSVQNVWMKKFQRPDNNNDLLDFDEVQREMNLFSSQLTNHASEATTMEVDDDVVECLEDTSEACRAVYQIHTHTNCLPEFREQSEEMMEQAERLEETALERL